MATTLPLLRGKTTLSGALDEDRDMLLELSYPQKRLDFYLYLYQNRPQIEDIAARHLRLSRQDLRLGDVKEWIHGSFNMCMPVYIDASEASRQARGLPPKALIRFPLPYKIGADIAPENVDEKLRCEAATYLWLQKNCPDVPIPQLLGFGFPGGPSFTMLRTSSFWDRLKWYFRCGMAYLFRRPLPPPYIAHPRKSLLDTGYLLLEYVQDGKMLSLSWEEHQSDPERRANLYRGLSRVMLQLAAVPMPRIGAWTMDDHGRLSLTNRPLTYPFLQNENHGIPTHVPRNKTYTSAAAYYLDLLAGCDSLLRQQPNAVHDEGDGEAQLAVLAAMRTVMPTFTFSAAAADRQHQHQHHRDDGPFAFAFTDMHRSNVFVDDHWNVTKIIDLEWACARPLEMLNPPSWLAGCDPTLLQGERRDKYEDLHEEFVQRFEEEEQAICGSNERAQMMRRRWDSGAFWYLCALEFPAALYSIVTHHILPGFVDFSQVTWKDFNSNMAPLWGLDVPEFLAAKVEEHEKYNDRLREMFAAAGEKDKEANDETKGTDGEESVKGKEKDKEINKETVDETVDETVNETSAA